MTPASSAAETASIVALLDRLDPQTAPCSVPGCLHAHRTSGSREDAPALAA